MESTGGMLISVFPGVVRILMPLPTYMALSRLELRNADLTGMVGASDVPSCADGVGSGGVGIMEEESRRDGTFSRKNGSLGFSRISSIPWLKVDSVGASRSGKAARPILVVSILSFHKY